MNWSDDPNTEAKLRIARLEKLVGVLLQDKLKHETYGVQKRQREEAHERYMERVTAECTNPNE